MKNYTCLIRGINVGGKNKIEMKKLKEVFTDLGFKSVVILGNTGVVIFTSESKVNTENIQAKLIKIFERDLKIIILSSEKIKRLVENKPLWWNSNKDYLHNVIFVLDNYNIENIVDDLQPLNEEIDKIKVVDNVIFWTSIYKDGRLYSKSLYAKLAKSKGYPYTSLRNGNTFNKIYEKIEKLK
ncbi:DUF1697 domain-containing protein [Miniphocaeibacter halophilus]|uniref:DUF1697 domain-containing protein n=1 Tax=Miniphocaeibacter halophilus TaxID=2931922 RepID=A0AC61MTE1_9FIRM|nr:DUF1697 domain-containing protein [Miniphocaeibacter halophilus]QQK08892.1 DUF1697 domain-containing protein [Miniphocaeibacter halophilus]